MRKFLVLGVIVAAVGFFAFGGQNVPHVPAASTARAAGNDAVFANAFDKQVSDIQVEGEGSVVNILPDDNSGARHQRFVVRLESGQTLLIAHNIDLAPRIPSLKVGDTVAFSGEYEWSPKGGIVHWTHDDPDGRHQAGWLRHNGRSFR